MKSIKKWLYIGLSCFIIIGTIFFTQINLTAKDDSSESIKSIVTSAISTSTKDSQTETNEVDLDNGDEDIDWDSLPTKKITLNNETLNITEAGTYELTGSSTAGVHINTEENVRLILNGVTIKSNDGEAIYVEQAKNTVIELSEGSNNTLEDSATRSDESIDGTIYSKDDLIFTGTGTLNVVSNFADGIVSKDDLKFISGNYIVKSEDDGIRGKDSVYIVDGTFTIDAAADGIKSTNDTDETKGFVYIAGGSITVNSGDDAIHAEEKMVIDDGTIDIQSGVEGLEATLMSINGGNITIKASDDGINAVASNFSDPIIAINDGTIDITMEEGDTDAIDSNGDIIVNGGNITISGNSSFDYDGNATYNGGTIIINGEEVNKIPENMMGGGARMGGSRH
ncbi:carbohydrate-binding domain-containing protein [Vagococcus luciliae]|uniref:Carbohydrate-binding domain-containing protein n=1 Tax=Vagococcus luciliae TaxID=2920380 RepID=A0ABY5NX62_9ENTE|nr:carbohydrate-binding domain-containing protein [Vagococcus luciliae]UUV98184.1 hypothetical protein G314FT_02750 [Vagococcus luciliae]